MQLEPVSLTGRKPEPLPPVLNLHFLETKLLAYDLAQSIRNLPMSRHRSLPTSRGVKVDIMASAIAVKHASRPIKFAYELLTLHTSSSTSCRSAVSGAAVRS
jgi:hypothetical protein